MPVVKKVVKKSTKPSAAKNTTKKVATKKVVKKTKTPPVVESTSTPVVETPVVETPVVETPVVESTPTLTETFDQLLNELNTVVKAVREVSTVTRQLRTVAERRVRTAERTARVASRQRLRNTPNTLPRQLDDELAEFLGVESGTKMSMRDVCGRLTSYFKEHNLHSEDNRTHLVLNEALTHLFAPDSDVTVTTRNYRRFVTPHFVTA